MKEPVAILILASSESKSYHINPINKKHEGTDALWKAQGNSLSVLITIIKNPKPIKQLDKSPESYDICKRIIDLDIHFICHLNWSLHTIFTTLSRNWRS